MADETAPDPPGRPTTPAQAWAALVAGNERFVAGVPAHPNQDAGHRMTLAGGQQPFASLFGCGDSRVAAEVVFDQGLGDLFVTRTAGHVAGESVLGSLEFGPEMLDIPLIVVLGHDRCGAIEATMRALDSGQMPPGYIADLVQRLAPSVLAARRRGTTDAREVGVEHVRATMHLLADRSRLLATRISRGRLAVIGAQYDLADGRAHFIDAIGDVGSGETRQ